jgi:hypothetical protein
MSTSAFAQPAWLRKGSQQAGRARRPSWNRRAAAQTLGGLLVAVVAAALAVVVTHGTSLKGVAALIVVIGSVWFATTRNTQLAMAVLMLYLGLLDGYLKLATGSTAVTFVRDAFLFALVFGLLVRATVRHERLPLPPLSGWLIALLLVVAVQFANPRAGTLVHSVAGARQHLEFIPLFFLTFAYLRTARALRTFFVLLAVIAACNAIATVVQFNESPQQFAAWGPGYAQRINGTGAFAGGGRTFATSSGQTKTRPFGLGSDAGDGGMFCMVALCGIFALAVTSKRRRGQLFAVAMALAALLGIITSEGRSVVVLAVIAVVVFGLLTITARTRLTSLLVLAAVIAASAFIVEGIVATTGSSQLRYAGLSPSGIFQTESTARGESLNVIPYNLATYPFGAGLGTVGPSSTAPGASQTEESGPDAETAFSYLTVEIGIPGMLVVLGFLLTLLVLGFRRCRQVPDPEARLLLAAVIAPLAGLLAYSFSGAWPPQVPAGPYLYAAGGIISYWLVTLPAQRGSLPVAASASRQLPEPILALSHPAQ